MRRVMTRADFARWLSQFLPGIEGTIGRAGARPAPTNVGTTTSGATRARVEKTFPLSPAVVTDPTDPRLVHLDGLNLTRAWTLNAIARALPAADQRRKFLETAAASHAKAGLARVSSGNYEGEHWLASFAVYLLTESGASKSR